MIVSLKRATCFFSFMSTVHRVSQDQLRPTEIPRAIEVYLAASIFGDYQAKEAAIRAAEGLQHKSPNLLQASNSHFHRIQLSHLAGTPSTLPTPLPVHGRQGNIYLGWFRILEAQHLQSKRISLALGSRCNNGHLKMLHSFLVSRT